MLRWMHFVACTTPALESRESGVRQKWLKGIVVYVVRSNSPFFTGRNIGPCNCTECGGNASWAECFITPTPDFVSSSPCEDCTSLLNRLNVRKVAYSSEKNEIVYTKLRDYETYGPTTGKKYTFLDGYDY